MVQKSIFQDRKKSCVISILLLLVILTNCESEKKDYDRVVKQGTIDAYEAFLEKRPESVFAEEALAAIWNLTLNRNDMPGYEAFLSKHPHTQFSESALDSIWGMTVKANKLDDYEFFRQKYKDSQYGEMALNGIWKLTAKQKSIQACNDFLRKYPNSSLTATVEKEITKLFRLTVPKKPTGELNSNLSVDLDWPSTPEADSYRIYWTYGTTSGITSKNSESTTSTYLKHWPRAGAFPVYYRIVAFRGKARTKYSKAIKIALLSSQGGKKCQICGNASIGWCHNRDIYVCNAHNIYTAQNGTRWRCP